MKTDPSSASFRHSCTVDEKPIKLLTGKTEPLGPDPVADAAHADESPDGALLEVVEYRP